MHGGNAPQKIIAGKKPASAMPRKKRTARRPEAFCTFEVSVQMKPQMTVRSGIYHLGLSLLRRMLLGVS